MFRPTFRLTVLAHAAGTLAPKSVSIEEARAAIAPGTNVEFDCSGNSQGCHKTAPAYWMHNMRLEAANDQGFALLCPSCTYAARNKGFKSEVDARNGYDGELDLYPFAGTIRGKIRRFEAKIADLEAQEAERKERDARRAREKAEQKAKLAAWQANYRIEQELRRQLNRGRNPSLPVSVGDMLTVVDGGTTKADPSEKPTSRKQRKSRGFDWVAAERERKARESAAQAEQEAKGSDEESAQA